MKYAVLMFCSLTSLGMLAQPGSLQLPIVHSCLLPPPDSVDLTGDGIADFVVLGILGEATCDIPVSHGGCEVVVIALPGTQLLSHRLPMGGREITGFAKGDTIPVLKEGFRDDYRIPRHAFIDGAVHALQWSYGRNGTGTPRLAQGADRVFVFATVHGEKVVHGTFTLEVIADRRTVRIEPGSLTVGDTPVIVP